MVTRSPLSASLSSGASGEGARRSGACASATSYSAALDEARGRDLAFEMLGGDVGAGRRQARIESVIHSGR